MKIVFMGTSDFAVHSLYELVNCANYEVLAVYTQCPKQSGRGMHLQLSPVQKFAENNNIPVFSPLDMRDVDLHSQLKSFTPDFLVVVAYGKILPKEILSIPRFGVINVHGSILPAWRGAAPVERSIIAGDFNNIGVTTMLLDEGMDTGDILLSQKVDLDMSFSLLEFKELLAKIGSKLLIETLDNFQNIKQYKQDNSFATIANKISSQEYLLDWNKNADVLKRQIYAFNPKCFFNHNGIAIKVLKSLDLVREIGDFGPGSVVSLNPLLVKCGNGLLELIELQKLGKKSVSVKDFLNGYNLKIGDVLV